MNTFVGTKRLVRLALRRDRISLPITISVALAMVAGSAPALISTYPNYEARFAYIASSAPSVVGRLFQGTVQGVNIGSIMMAETFLNIAIILGVMSIFIVTRHTRYNEEIGAGELIGSTVVGRSAPLTAALIVAVGANVVTGILLFASLLGVSELSTIGSAYYAASLAMVGIFFAGVAAVTAQLSDYRRGANGMAIGALIGAFIVRGFGDSLGGISADGLSVTAGWLTWLSPIGWGYQTLPYNGNRAFPLVMLLTGFVVLVTFAYLLMRRRDIGSSIFQTKAGPERASNKLLGLFGLTKRLQLGTVAAWLIGFAVSGVLMAVVASDFQDTFKEAENFQEFLAAADTGGSFVETIISAMFPILSAMLAGLVVTLLSKMHDEESSGRLEYLLGTALSKTKWLFSHIRFAVVSVVAALAAMGAAGGLGYVLTAEVHDTTFWRVVGAAIVNIPAMHLFMTIVLLVFSIFGRFVKSFAWSYYAYGALIGSLAGIFSWPQWTMNISPFGHTPAYPSSDLDYTPLVIMTGLSVAGTLLAVWIFRHRDIALK